MYVIITTKDRLDMSSKGWVLLNMIPVNSPALKHGGYARQQLFYFLICYLIKDKFGQIYKICLDILSTKLVKLQGYSVIHMSPNNLA